MNFTLSPPYPNPFNSSVRISFAVPVAGEVTITVYDITGRVVEMLSAGDWGLGYHSIVWDADNCASGVYFVRMETKAFTKTQKLVYLR